MSRISRDQMFMQIAEVVARRSTCFRRSVGAVITIDNRIVSIGYNGPAAGEPHCTGNGCADPKKGCTRAVHAEINAINYIPTGLKNRLAAMYVTESPCPHCAEVIAKSSSIYKIYYLNQYRLVEGLDLLLKDGVTLFRMTPAGYVINYKTNEIVDA